MYKNVSVINKYFVLHLSQVDCFYASYVDMAFVAVFQNGHFFYQKSFSVILSRILFRKLTIITWITFTNFDVQLNEPKTF